ncbi:MAG: hypothetical protein H6Q70_1408 [Firmicutes bacterium]|nr:hypothetical protein [Bacillota bacterium]
MQELLLSEKIVVTIASIESMKCAYLVSDTEKTGKFVIAEEHIV